MKIGHRGTSPIIGDRPNHMAVIKKICFFRRSLIVADKLKQTKHMKTVQDKTYSVEEHLEKSEYESKSR